MTKVFPDDLGTAQDQDRLDRIFIKYPKLDRGYVGVSCIPHQKPCKDKIEQLWLKYAPYADSSFLSKIKVEFLPRCWEMYVASTLLERGLTLTPKNTIAGPDIRLAMAGKTAWVEAISVKMGDGQDRVPEMVYGAVVDLPEEEMLLRIANALAFKFSKYERYLANGTVKPDEPYIIAISKGEIPHPDPGMPLAMKALFGIGYQVLRIRDASGARVAAPESSWSARREIIKANGEPVSMTFFEDAAHSGVSAVIYCEKNFLNHPDNLGEDLWVIHNPLAKHPIPINLLGVGFEWVPEDTSMKLRDRNERS